MLTIAIPTYNRKQQLLRTLKALSKQTNGEFKVVISDNNSDYDVQKMIMDEFNDEFRNKIVYKRRNVNIGADNNIIGLFELVEDEWMWMISDDDDIHNDAVAKVYELIKKNNDCAVIQFSESDIYTSDMQFNDLESYVKSMYDIWNRKTSLIIAGNLYACYNKLYKMDSIKECLYIPFKYNYSCMTTGLVVLSALKNGKKVSFTQAKIMDITPPEWSSMMVALGNRIVDDIDFGITKDLKKKLLCLISFPYRVLIRHWLEKENHYDENLYIEKLYYGYYKYHLPVLDRLNYWLNIKVCSVDVLYKLNLKIRQLEKSIRNKYKK